MRDMSCVRNTRDLLALIQFLTLCILLLVLFETYKISAMQWF